MALPYLKINSMSYTYSPGLTGVLSINTSYGYLRGGGSVSITGLTQTLYYSITSSYGANITNTFSIKVATASAFNLTFSFYKGPYYNYPFGQPSKTGITQTSTGSSYGPFTPYSGGIAYNLGFATFSAIGILYETNRYFPYSFITN